VTGKQVQCSSMGLDQHGGTLGRCMVGTTDINRTVVALGYAVGIVSSGFPFDPETSQRSHSR
jgi:endonuclease YncB( thermonuclease family)